MANFVDVLKTWLANRECGMTREADEERLWRAGAISKDQCHAMREKEKQAAVQPKQITRQFNMSLEKAEHADKKSAEATPEAPKPPKSPKLS